MRTRQNEASVMWSSNRKGTGDAWERWEGEAISATDVVEVGTEKSFIGVTIR